MTIPALFDSLGRDMRYATRMLRHNPMFTCVALLTLAIGIGANSAVFSVVNSVLLRPLSYPHADELVAVRHNAPGAAGLSVASGELDVSPPAYFTYSEQNRTFQALGIWATMTQAVTGLAEPEQVRVVAISDGVLQALSTPPFLGRWLASDDQAPSGPERVMLGYGYWLRRFGGDQSVIGRSIAVDSRPRQIVGVMPQGFRIVDANPELIVPFAFDRSKLRLPGFPYQCIARLKPGITIAQADADIERMIPIWINSWPANPGALPQSWLTAWRIAPAIRPLKQDVIGNVSDMLWVVMGTIGIVMLIACANVANLVLVRAEARQKELSIRAALGAGRGRIARGILLESLLLGIAGGVLGLVLADQGLRLLVAMGPANLPRLGEIGLDGRALGFTLILSSLSGVLLGLIPALKYAGPRLAFALRSAGRNASLSRERHRATDLLVVAQVAMALVLTVSAGLMLRTFQALRSVDPGFTHPEQLQTLHIDLPSSLFSEPERVTRMQNDIVDQLSAIPGVASVGFASDVPMEGPAQSVDAIYAEGQTHPRGEIPPLRLFKRVSPGFFKTSGTRIVAGRELTWTEVYGLRPVAMVSENLARELWGTPAAAVGKRIREYPGMAWREVIGVIQDVRQNGVHENAPAIVYLPSMMEISPAVPSRSAVRTATFVLRSQRSGTASLLSQIRDAVWSVNSNLPIASVRTMQDIYDRSLARTSFTLVMLGIAGAMALLLGIVGIYGVISYAVSQRRREIGIRVALGAQPRQLSQMFLRHGLTLTGTGLAIGMGVAAALTRLMTSLLFGVSPIDPLTFALMAILLGFAAILASYLPARRASTVDPIETLGAE
jgi:predicted permease